MTCYMNSLLQSLFMTPEFRNALFQWKFEGPPEEAETSIPYQLQRLFVQLCDEAFRAMLKPERLDGSNQYYCSHCGKKQDAMLDCVYERMPYLLSLQLMRFTFDPRTGDRIKLNDRVSFPLEDWDISEFVVLPTDSPSHLEDHDASRTDCGAEGDHELFDDDEAVVCNLNEDGRAYCRPGLNGILSASNTTEPVEDEDVDLGTDSGANSGLDSPFGASSSLSPPHPMDGSASDSHHEVMDQEDGVPDQQPTLTVDQASQLRLSSFTRSMTDPLDTDDDDNDDGFGTGDTQSACSSLHDQNHDQQHFVDGPIHSTQPATLLVTAPKTTGVVGGIMLDRTPTKTTMDEMQPATNAAHPASKPTSKLVYKLSFADNQWYQFNDRHVTRANYADLLNTFGAKQPSYLSRASAYYLMYRRVDPLNNEHFLHEDEFPPHIAQMVNVSTRCPVTQEIISSSVDVYKDQTIEEATAIARAALLPTYGDVKNVNCRLVQYASYNDCFGQSVEYAMWRRSVGTQAENLPKLLGKEPVQRPMEGFSSSEVPTSQTLQSVCTEKPKAAPACGTASPLLVDEFINSYCTLWLEHRLNVPGALGSPVLDNKWRTYEPKGGLLYVNGLSSVSNE
ncbi:Ubiquitin carboxyl-terminal hydrolase 64E [Fasciola gigantica]|uniref:Ubiquitin carboxyl-terminal hydrolase 64E n=1 Tax=Fasciola gigantica TaxID=46835 RepID=A0A504Y943_FASGI|nr:Ubiquitin carboxyl-terminal hydrolase 64E [Fasciola gigantica]